MTLELRSVNNDSAYEICVEEDGFRECTLVSSMHMAAEEQQRLRANIRRRAFNAFIERQAK